MREWYEGQSHSRQYAARLTTFIIPMRAEECPICRCKLLASTTSPSTTPSVPTPAPARYAAAGQPRPPAPTIKTRDAFKRCWPAIWTVSYVLHEVGEGEKGGGKEIQKPPTTYAHLGQDQLPAIALILVLPQRPLPHSRRGALHGPPRRFLVGGGGRESRQLCSQCLELLLGLGDLRTQLRLGGPRRRHEEAGLGRRGSEAVLECWIQGGACQWDGPSTARRVVGHSLSKGAPRGDVLYSYSASERPCFPLQPVAISPEICPPSQRHQSSALYNHGDVCWGVWCTGYVVMWHSAKT